MNELIKINENQISDETVDTVSARELHEFLGVGTRYNDWFSRRTKDYGFTENIDYVCLIQKRVTQTSEGKEGAAVEQVHYITLNMAKELAMVERNDKGREARRYLIECEKQLKMLKTPSNYIEALEALLLSEKEKQSLERTIQFQDKIIEKQKPKVTYHDIVLSCSDLLTTTQVAKDFGIRGQKLNKILNEEGIQYKDNIGLWRIYSEYLSNNYAHYQSSHTYQDKDGDYHTELHLKWTQKGRLFIYDLLKSRGILPICEQE